MAEILKHNRPLQCYIISSVSDKIAQQTTSQAVIVTMMNGILIGNMGLATILSVIGMLPSILFAVAVRNMPESSEARKQSSVGLASVSQSA